VDGKKVVLVWASPKMDGGSPVTGYHVLRGEATDELEVVAQLGPVESWTDEDTKRGKAYFYSIVAINDIGEGQPCASYRVKVPPKESEGPGPGAIATLVALATIVVLASVRRRR
jgi:hypothetical protein